MDKFNANFLLRLWNNLTAPKSENPDKARYEYMTKVLSLITGVITFIFTIVFLVGWLLNYLPFDSLIILFGITILMAIGICVTYAGFWRSAGALPPMVIYFTAVYGSYIGGPDAPAMLIFALAIIMTAIQQGQRAQWAMFALCVVSYLGIAFAHHRGIIPQLRYPEAAFFNRIGIVTATLTAITSLLWFLSSQYRSALGKARTMTRELEEVASELSEANLNMETEIAERQRAEEQINSSLKEKEVLLKEIHHRVKNNFQIIISLLNLQSGGITDANLLRLFNESVNRIRAMALVHEELYQSESISDIDFATYLRTISEELYISYASGPHKPELIIESENIYLGIDQAIPCGLILNELLTNSLKYAFPGSSDNKITVTMCASGNGEITLSISDNGIGLSENIDIEKISSLGLQLVSVLIKQIHGRYQIDRQNGTSWIITFPANIPTAHT
jgi:two-component sensor histidine kinase